MFTPDKNISGYVYHTELESSSKPELSKNVTSLKQCILKSTPNQAAIVATLNSEFGDEANRKPPQWLANLFALLPPPNLTTIQDNYDILTASTDEDANEFLQGFTKDKS